MGRQFELTDEMADRILTNLKQADPEKAAELEQLRKSDPEKFKTELQSSMRNMMRGRNRQGQGGGRNRGEGFGGDDEQQGGGGQGGNRSREGLGGETDQ